MGYSHFAPVRDLLYLSSMLLGFSLGSALPMLLYRLHFSRKSIARRLVAASLLLAAALSCATVSFVLSGGAVFGDTSLLTAALPFFVFALCGVLFPRIVGFPLFVAVLSAVVLFSWAFLVFPDAREGALLGRIRVSVSGEARVWFDADAVPDIAASIPDPRGLRFFTLRIDFDRLMPLVGGMSRVALREITDGDASIGVRFRRSLVELIGPINGTNFLVVPGVSSKTVQFPMPDTSAADGARRDIIWMNGHLRFIE